MGQQDHVARVQGDGGDNGLVKGPEHVLVLEGALPQGGEQAVLVAVRHLARPEGDVQQVLVLLAREHLAEESQVLFRLVLGHQAHGLVKFGDDLLLHADVAAADVGDIVPVRPEAPPELGDFFAVHGYLVQNHRMGPL